jgi:DNA-binding beta-propeller fold protein YncE
MTSSVYSKKARCVVFVLALALIESSCGDVYRPVAQVIPGTPPNPAAVHFVVSLSTNGNTDSGTANHVDVSGDTSLGAFLTGLMPVHAALTANASRLYVANLDDDTITANVTSSPTAASVISLAQGAQPVFVHTAENNNVYVANFGTSTVSVINANSNALAGPDVAVGANPVALAEMPVAGATNQKLYVANENSPNVSVINVLDDSLGTQVPIGTGQVWATARADGQRIYVLDKNGTVSAINTLTDLVLNNTGVASAGAGANFMFLDAKAQRLYVTNPSPAVHSLSIFDISEANPAMPVNRVASIDLGQGAAPFYLPVSVTGIGDGSRAYVASYQIAKCQPGNYDCVNTQVAVISVGNSTVSKIIPVASGVPIDLANQNGCGALAPTPAAWTPADGARFRLFATASGGGSTSNFKIYVAQCDAQNVAVIDTFPANSNPADTFAGVAIPSPLSAFPGVQVGISAAAQSSTTTTYSYTQSSANPNLQVGQSIFITGMSDAGNNGTFTISGGNLVAGPGSGTFTVTNPSGVTNGTQSGTGAVLLRQNPVFLVAGP